VPTAAAREIMHQWHNTMRGADKRANSALTAILEPLLALQTNCLAVPTDADTVVRLLIEQGASFEPGSTGINPRDVATILAYVGPLERYPARGGPALPPGAWLVPALWSAGRAFIERTATALLDYLHCQPQPPSSSFLHARLSRVTGNATMREGCRVRPPLRPPRPNRAMDSVAAREPLASPSPQATHQLRRPRPPLPRLVPPPPLPDRRARVPGLDCLRRHAGGRARAQRPRRLHPGAARPHQRRRGVVHALALPRPQQPRHHAEEPAPAQAAQRGCARQSSAGPSPRGLPAST
jgi:hypothetical protein